MSTADPLSQNLHFNKTPRLFLCSVKSEEHRPKSKSLTQQTGLFNIWPHTTLSQAIFCQFLYVSFMAIHFSRIILYSEVLMLFSLSGLTFLLFWLTGSINPSTQSSIPQIYFCETYRSFFKQSISCISILSLTSLYCNYLFNCIFFLLTMSSLAAVICLNSIYNHQA